MENNDINKLSENIFLNQAKIGAVLALHEDKIESQAFRDSLKNGIKIHKRQREIIKNLSSFLEMKDYDDEVNINKQKGIKTEINKLNTIKEQVDFVINLSYDSMKNSDLLINKVSLTPPSIKEQLKHLRNGYLNFIDEIQTFIK